ncbi:hypothetical protein J1N35_041296 [Gossypium stocksii]|uniref:Secreted protein n=1 Tax=Gossypium stocksii TaxID=47602 RepID=A0A9D3ZJ91_9ROSI|nr:hypothetical protein J1N35_041296 [Gossypium stocksii]
MTIPVLFPFMCVLSVLELSMGEEASSNKVMAMVPAENELVAPTPKFKWRRVSAVQDFPPRCGRWLHQTLDQVSKSQLIDLVRASGSRSFG